MIDKASTLEDYVTALKISPSGAYFGDALENYLSGLSVSIAGVLHNAIEPL